MEINVQWISLTQERLLRDLINVLGHFPVILQP